MKEIKYQQKYVRQLDSTDRYHHQELHGFLRQNQENAC
jgi:hypothetical protein